MVWSLKWNVRFKEGTKIRNCAHKQGEGNMADKNFHPERVGYRSRELQEAGYSSSRDRLTF